MKTIVCPRCFSKSEIKNLAWGCSNSDCPKEAVPVTSTDNNPVCSACHKPLTMRFCPECGFQIDKIMHNFKNLPISIAGSGAAGKSHYLTVLLNELRNRVGAIYNFSLLPVGGDDTMNQYNELYYKPIYEEHVCIDSTMQDFIRPMIYSMAFDKNEYGKTSTFTFYDACGQNFKNERAMADYNRSIINSLGSILLIDPSQLPLLREEYLKKGIPVLEDDFSSLLSRTITLIRDGKNQNNMNEKLDIPVAVCISKLDTIKDRLDSSSFLQYPSRHLNQPEFDITDYTCCNKEVEALIEYWGGTDILNQLRSQFSSFGCFAFSSLGYPPNDQKIMHLAPHRVCDPFLWLMAKNNVITAKKHTV